MKKELKTVILSIMLALTASTLIALAEKHPKWETRLHGVDVRLNGSVEQVRNPKLQRECLKMASYALQQFQANGGVFTSKSHEVECQVSADGSVSALLTQTPQEQKETKDSANALSPQDMPKPAGDISTQR